MARITIPRSEYFERIARVQSAMERENLDLLLAFATESEPAFVRYLSGYWPNFETAAVLVPRVGEAVLITGPESILFGPHFNQLNHMVRVMDFRSSAQPAYPGFELNTWKEILSGYSPKRIGIAGWLLFPHVVFDNLREALSKDVQIVNADRLLQELKAIKSENELNCLREAARIGEIGLKALLDVIHPDMLETEANGVALAAMLAAGAEAPGYMYWVVGGEKTTQAIGRSEPIKLGRGPVQIGIGARYEGYVTSIMRPLYFDKMPDDVRDFYQCALDAEQFCGEQLYAGDVASKAANDTQDFIRSRGYGDAILYGPAHACGQMEAEWPFIETTSDVVLQKNMTFDICLFLWKPGIGQRYEDAIIVRDGSPEWLSTYRREIIVL